MASNVQFAASLLRRLHSLQQQRSDLKNQLERGPRQIKAGEALVATAEKSVEEMAQKIKQATIAADRKQLQLQEREDKIKDLNAKLNTAASNREFDTLKEQIAADEQANSVLSDEILEALEQLDEFNADLEQRQAELKKQQDDQQNRELEIQNRMEVVRGNLGHVESELQKSEAEIPSEAKRDYIRLTKSRGEEALAPLEDGTCGGCSQTMTTQLQEQLRMSMLVNCPACNAILYIPEDTRVK